MNGSLKKGMLAIFGANIINLVFNLLTNFLLPKYLSVDSYAAIKTFQLYTTYIGIFALGYSDGMYLRYGGQELDKIDRKELKTGMFTFRIMMIIESIIFAPFAFIYGDKIILGFVFTILSMNMTSYFKNLYQAVGEFKLYGKVLNWTTIATFAVNIGLLFLIKTDNFFAYLICYAIVDAAIWIVLEINIHRLLKSVGRVSVSLKLLWEDIKSGFLLMIGNFSNILLSSMDRWFVKIMMDSAPFAYYSFAVSMEGFLNVAITPITTTLYNYFCNHLEYNDVVKTRRYVLLFGSVIIVAAFPAKFIIEIYLKNYLGSVNVLFILFATQMVYVVIKGIYVNLYKATRRQKMYFIRLVLILIIGALLNYVFVKIYPYKEAFSYGTLVSAFMWLAFCIWDFKEYKFSIKEGLYIIVEAAIFIFLGQEVNSIIGFAIYVIFTLAMMRIFMRTDLIALLQMVKGLVRRNK